MWTGTGVPSEHWTAGRRPRLRRAHRPRAAGLGQLDQQRHRRQRHSAGDGADLPRAVPARAGVRADAVGGFFLNAANEAYLNLLPLATAGDWMADPAGYRARRSWLAAIRELAPGKRRSRAPPAGVAARLGRGELVEQARPRARGADLRRQVGPPSWPATTPAAPGRRACAGCCASCAWSRPRRERLPDLPEPGIAEQGAEFLDAAAKTALAGDLAAQLLAAERPLLELRAGVAACAGAPCRPTRRAPASSAGSADAAALGRRARHRVHLRLADADGVRDPALSGPRQRHGRVRRPGLGARLRLAGTRRTRPRRRSR